MVMQPLARLDTGVYSLANLVLPAIQAARPEQDSSCAYCWCFLPSRQQGQSRTFFLLGTASIIQISLSAILRQ